MSSSPEFSAEQLASARVVSWHQSGEPLLTLDSVREWLTANGLVLFQPRPLQLPSPAPSLVEATIGASSGGPTNAQIAAARSLVARLVAEGNLLPLNLLGLPGELPDFVVSAQAFSFVFTLRGDKTWKLPPSTTGTFKVSPLGLHVYEVLSEKGALSAADLATELGREVTEAAILRALNELWSHLRVIPLFQQGDAPTLWELTTRRFTKAIKAGINAGQPTALSALISLYLSQSLLANEEEVETFLSPLAARSRIREVLHALTASRQLEASVLDGKTLLFIPGTLPEFPSAQPPGAVLTEVDDAVGSSLQSPVLEGEGRIKRFAPDSKREFADFKGKPSKSLTSGFRTTPRSASKPEPQRRPFKRAAPETGYTKPWSEERKTDAGADGARPKHPYTPRTSPGAAKFPGKPRGTYGASAAAGRASERPFARKDAGTVDRPARGNDKSFAPRSYAKKPYSTERKPFVPRDLTGDNARRPRTSSASGSSFAGRNAATSSEGRPFRKFDAPPASAAKRVSREARPAYGGSNSKPRPPKEPKTASAEWTPKRPSSRNAGEFGDRSARPSFAKTGRSDGRPGGPGSKPRAPRKEFSERPDRPSGKSFGSRPREGKSFGKGPISRGTPAFGKRPAPGDGNVSSGARPAPRRGVPGVKPPFPRKPRAEHTED